MVDQSVTYFPVGNGDTSLLRLSDGATILLDCHIRKVEPGVYPVHTCLLKILKQDGKVIPHVNVFVLTHPHDDHCKGFEEVFYLGDPASYTDDDRRAGKIIIDELWFAPRIFNEYVRDLCEDAKAFRAEARRRADLYRSKKNSRSEPGNRLRVIGYSGNAEVEGLDDILTVPGTILSLVNGKVYQDFRFFVYAPVRGDTDSSDSKLNDTSIVLQARFDVDGVEDAARLFFGGDAECRVWERIVDKNQDNDQNLEWDMLLTPHHCSWSFFSAEPYDESDPSDKVMHLLRLKRGQAYVIASSKPIKNDDDNPPHYGAKQVYEGVVETDRFLCTGEHPDEENPKPIYFTMTTNGPVKDDLPGGGKVSSAAAVLSTVSEPRHYGE